MLARVAGAARALSATRAVEGGPRGARFRIHQSEPAVRGGRLAAAARKDEKHDRDHNEKHTGSQFRHDLKLESARETSAAEHGLVDTVKNPTEGGCDIRNTKSEYHEPAGQIDREPYRSRHFAIARWLDRDGWSGIRHMSPMKFEI